MYDLIYTNNKEIMERFGIRYGFSYFKEETIAIEHQMKATPDLVLNDAESQLPTKIVFRDTEGTGFTLHPKQMFKRGNSVAIITKQSLYVFQEIRTIIE